MYRELIIRSFEKAEQELGVCTKSRLAVHLSDFIQENSGEQFGDRRLRELYKLALGDASAKIELKQFVADALSTYLGHEDYFDFKDQNQPKNSGTQNHRKKKINFKKEYWLVLAVTSISLIIILRLTLNKQRWMAWENDRYVAVKFDEKKYELSGLKVYDEDRIRYFKKINPDCNTVYFTPTGEVNLWYGKSPEGKLEYFTALGKHPVTGKTLKPITAYMIRKYICKTY